MNDELKKRFEQVFGIPFERGLDQVRSLIKCSISMGRNAAEAGFGDGATLDTGIFKGATMKGYTRMNDGDFLKVAFFAMVGAELHEELGMPKQIEAPKTNRFDLTLEVVKCQKCGADAEVAEDDRRFLVCSNLLCEWRSEVPGMYVRKAIDV